MSVWGILYHERDGNTPRSPLPANPAGVLGLDLLRVAPGREGADLLATGAQ